MLVGKNTCMLKNGMEIKIIAEERKLGGLLYLI